MRLYLLWELKFRFPHTVTLILLSILTPNFKECNKKVISFPLEPIRISMYILKKCVSLGQCKWMTLRRICFFLCVQYWNRTYILVFCSYMGVYTTVLFSHFFAFSKKIAKYLLSFIVGNNISRLSNNHAAFLWGLRKHIEISFAGIEHVLWCLVTSPRLFL